MKKAIKFIVPIFAVLMLAGIASAAIGTFVATNDPKTTFTYGKDANGKNTASVLVGIKNIGEFPESGIIELQFAHNLFSFGELGACDPSTPWNVHRTYTIGGGKSDQLILTSTNIPDGTYFPKLVHVNQCCTDGTNSYLCDALQPYAWGSSLTDSPITFSSGGTPQKVECDYPAQCTQILANKGITCQQPKCNNQGQTSSYCSCEDPGSPPIGPDFDFSKLGFFPIILIVGVILFFIWRKK